MNAPRRLLEDPATADALRADLQAAATHQVGYDLSSGLARFEANLPNIGAGSGAASGGHSLLVKLGIVGALGGALALGISLSSPTKAPAPSAHEASSVEAAKRVAPPAPDRAATDEREPSAPSAEPEASVQDAEAPPAPKAVVKPAPRPASQSSAASRDDLLAEEVRQLRQIRLALASDPARALQLANQGHARFRKGVLYQEREALALSALSALGRRQELEQRGTRYLKAFPGGAFSGRVRQLLAR